MKMLTAILRGMTIGSLLVPALPAVAAGLQQAARLSSSESARGEQFGWSVAMSARTIAVGAPGADGGGAVFVFVEEGGAWVLQQELVPWDSSDDASFGRSVALSEDLLAVGAPYANSTRASTGAVYLFSRNSESRWRRTAKLFVDDLRRNDGFGSSVSVTQAAVLAGAPFRDEAGSKSGSAYVFRRGQDNQWTSSAHLVADVPGRGDRFGYSVALAGDLAVVGAPYARLKGIYRSPVDDTEEEVLRQMGCAYVFRAQDANEWTDEAVLCDPSFWADDLRAGYSVAVSDRTKTAVVGVPCEGYFRNRGAALVFHEDPIEGWEFVSKVKNPGSKGTNGDGDYLGYSVALAGVRFLVGPGERSEFPSDRASRFETRPRPVLLFEDDASDDGAFVERISPPERRRGGLVRPVRRPDRRICRGRSAASERRSASGRGLCLRFRIARPQAVLGDPNAPAPIAQPPRL